MYVIIPAQTESERIYSLLSHHAGITLTDADVIVKSVTKATEVDENGDWQDSVTLEYVPTSTLLKADDGVSTADTSVTCLDIAKVVSGLGLGEIPTIYEVNNTGLVSWDLKFSSVAFQRITDQLGINITDDMIVAHEKTGSEDKKWSDYKLQIETFGFRGELNIHVEIDTRKTFSTLFNSTPLDGFAAPTQVMTLEGNDVTPPETTETTE